MKTLLFSGTLCLFCWSATLAAQEAPQVYGRITDSNGKGIVKATVILTCDSGLTIKTHTWSGGDYHIDGFMGFCRIDALAPGFQLAVVMKRREFKLACCEGFEANGRLSVPASTTPRNLSFPPASPSRKSGANTRRT
jgi:hypothetical protein